MFSKCTSDHYICEECFFNSIKQNYPWEICIFPKCSSPMYLNKILANKKSNETIKMDIINQGTKILNGFEADAPTKLSYVLCCNGLTLEECNTCHKQYCNTCLQVKFDPNDPSSSSDEHKCIEEHLEAAKKIKEKTRHCPKCHILIERTEGCSHMFCTSCNTCFDWDSGHIMISNSNPLYQQFIQETGGCINNTPLAHCINLSADKTILGGIYQLVRDLETIIATSHGPLTATVDYTTFYRSLKTTKGFLGEFKQKYFIYKSKKIGLVLGELLIMFLNPLYPILKLLEENLTHYNKAMEFFFAYFKHVGHLGFVPLHQLSMLCSGTPINLEALTFYNEFNKNLEPGLKFFNPELHAQTASTFVHKLAESLNLKKKLFKILLHEIENFKREFTKYLEIYNIDFREFMNIMIFAFDLSYNQYKLLFHFLIYDESIFKEIISIDIDLLFSPVTINEQVFNYDPKLLDILIEGGKVLCQNQRQLDMKYFKSN